MKEAIIESLHELSELDAEQALLPSQLIEDICKMIDRLAVKTKTDKVHLINIKDVLNQVWVIFRANTQRGRELADQIKVTRKNIQGMVKAYGATVKAAGFSASFTKSSVYADLKRLKLDVEDDPGLARYLKQKAAYCSIKRSRA